MVVGDNDLGPVHVVEHVAGNELTAGVVAVGVVGLEDTQPIFDRQAGGTDQKATREMLACRTAHSIDRLPRDEHRHHRRLAGACGKLQREPHEFRVGVSIRRSEVIEQPLAVLELGCDFGEPDRGFHSLHLAEERADTAELVMAPVLKKTGCLRRDLPMTGVR